MAQRVAAGSAGGVEGISFSRSYLDGSFGPAPPRFGCTTQGSHDPPLFGQEEEATQHQAHTDSGEDESIFKILIVTDTHLGYKGEDPIRGNDSFRTFEEILHIGRSEGVDFILHGGDLFDENKPSRTTLYRAMCLLRKYCFGSGTVQFDVLSTSNSADPAETWDSTQLSGKDKARDVSASQRERGDLGGETQRKPTSAIAKDNPSSATQELATDMFRFGLNYLNENVNVCMPIFAMHGNHDDPGDASLLSPLDILEAAHLINYFGRVDNVEDIRIRPILLRKGSSKLAIYGMGWVRDERLHRAYTSGKVTYEVPAEGEVQNWFNVLLVHQNMYKGGHGSVPAKNCVLERMLPSFADVVIWGHEHDCHTEIRQSIEGRCQVLQPGSSIATSLTAGEAQQKHVFVMEVRGDCFRLRAVPLQTVRPLIVEDVCLADICGGISASGRGARPTAPTASGETTADREAWEALTSLMEDILRRYSQTAGIDLTSGATVPVSQQQLQPQQQKKGHLAQPRRRQAYQLFCNYRAGATQDLAAAPTTAAGGPLREALTVRGSAEVLQKLPLVRIRVEHTGFSTISAPRFASQFVGRVANPDSLLCFYKRRNNHRVPGAESSALPELEFEDIPGSGPSEIHDIIFHYMEDSSGLSVLPEPDFNDAVQDFVIKMDPSAISAFVASSLSAARLHARSELLKRLKANPDTAQSAEDVRAIISEFTQAARMRRLAAPKCDSQTANESSSGGSSELKQDKGELDAVTDARPPPTGEVEMTGAFLSDPSAVHGVSSGTQQGGPAAARCCRGARRDPAGEGSDVLQVSDGGEEQSDILFADVSSSWAPHKPSKRGAPKKQSVGKRSRNQGGATTQNRRNAVEDVISGSDSPEEERRTRASSESKRGAASSALSGVKHQRDIRSLLSQLSGRRSIQSQATSVARSRPGSDPPDVPTQESDSNSQVQWELHLGAYPAPAASGRHQPAKRPTPPRPMLPLGPPERGVLTGGASGEILNSMGAIQPSSWTKRAKINETQSYGAGQEESQSAMLRNSFSKGANEVMTPQRPESRTISWKRR